MAVVEKDKNTQILYKVQTGTSAGDNSPTYSTRTLSNISPNVTAQDALELGQAVGSLQKFPLGSVYLFIYYLYFRPLYFISTESYFGTYFKFS